MIGRFLCHPVLQLPQASLATLDLFEVHEWKCPEDEALYKQIIKKKRVFKFLMRLNKDLDEVRGRVLGTKPLPNVREAFSEVER